MKKILILIAMCILLALMACTDNGSNESNDDASESTYSEVASDDLQQNETADLELAPELLINQELADRIPYELWISRDEELLLVSLFTYHMHDNRRQDPRDNILATHSSFLSEPFPIEYFDGENWVVLPANDELLVRNEEYPISRELGYYGFISHGIYDFSWIRDAGFDLDNGLFRIRERISFSPEFPVDQSHDLVFEFSLREVNEEIGDVDAVKDNFHISNFNLEEVDGIGIIELSIQEQRLFGTLINYSDRDIYRDISFFEYFTGEEWLRVSRVDGLEGDSIVGAFQGLGSPGGIIAPYFLDFTEYDIPEGYPLRFRQAFCLYEADYRLCGHEDEALYYELIYEFTLE